MQTDRRGAIAAFLLVLLVGAATLSSTAPDLDYSQFEVLELLGASEQSNTTDWHTYSNDEYGFQIKCPPDFNLAESANALVASGAVVTFIQASDPSIDGTGAKTNLIAFSVTIGVTDSPVASPQRSALCLAYVPEQELTGPRDVGHSRFSKSYSSEGAAGNRYEKSSYFIDCGESRYEIALFVHSGNPGCYSPDSITIFDPAAIVRLFETMIGTFFPAS
ncbi:hypothetical protein ACFLS5_04525 [Candidatus Bipolaricaulota bacterium]